MPRDISLAQIGHLSDSHNKAAFSCGVESLDKYLQLQSGQDIRRKVAATFVMILPEEPDQIIGYYTLSSTAIDPGELAPTIRKKLPSYPLIPATLIGRLARDKKHANLGVGENLLLDALYRSYRHSAEIASFAVVVDAIDERAYSWYAQKWGFIKFQAQDSRLYLPMKTIQKLIPKALL